jgi:hypothetical protein
MKLFAAVLALTSASLSTLVRGEFCVPEESFTPISFENATLAVDDNKLHIEGGSMLIKNVGEYQNEQINMRITADENYHNIQAVWDDRDDKVRNANNKNFVSGDFMNINIQTVGSDADSGKATFTFCIENEEGKPQALDNFEIAVFDLDQRGKPGKNNNRAHERMIVNTQKDGFSQASVTAENTELEIYCKSEAEVWPYCTQIVFHSTTNGKESDNPGIKGKGVEDLTKQQMDRSVLLWYKETACFSIEYHHYCPNAEPRKNNNCNEYAGGNFQFAGYSQILTENTVCPGTLAPIAAPLTDEPTESPTEEPTDSPTKGPTESPTKEPTDSPTKGPTESPTKEPTDSPTKAPTESPTKKVLTKVDTLEPTGSIPAAPPVPPTEVPTEAPECPSKIEVLKTHGELDIGIAGAIKIVETSYDSDNPKDTTVTVALTNNWDAQIDKIYYQYKKDHFNEKCYNSTEVNIGETYSEITIQCHVTQPYATFELCLGDDNNEGSIFTNEDSATVPQCCHAKEHTFSACFNLYIWCTDECPAKEESVNRNRRGLRGKEGKQ